MRNPFDSHPWSASRWSVPWSRLPATAGVVVSTALLAGLTYAVWRTLRSTHASRHSAQPASQPEHLTRWESEGGGVPVGSGSSSRTTAELNPPATGSVAAGPARSSTLGSSTGGLPH